MISPNVRVDGNLHHSIITMNKFVNSEDCSADYAEIYVNVKGFWLIGFLSKCWQQCESLKIKVGPW